MILKILAIRIHSLPILEVSPPSHFSWSCTARVKFGHLGKGGEGGGEGRREEILSVSSINIFTEMVNKSTLRLHRQQTEFMMCL